MVGELLEAIFIVTGEQHETIDLTSSGMMTGFDVFIIVRFLWLRSIVFVESQRVNDYRDKDFASGQ
jgi:hypothetical protein